MNESNKTCPPILSRALELLPFLARVRERRYTEIRDTLKVGDASLSRLLKHLEDLGWVHSPSRGRYAMGKRFTELSEVLSLDVLEGEVSEEVRNLALKAEQSCAWVCMEDGFVSCRCRHSIENSISILRKGTLLHTEFDHAASLSVLSLSSLEMRRDSYSMPGSTISNEDDFQRSLRLFKRGEIFLDITKVRPGVSRIAIPFMYRGKPTSIFFCGPSVQIRQKWRWYRDLLIEARDRLSEQLKAGPKIKHTSASHPQE